jgi:hypothetical protein
MSQKMILKIKNRNYYSYLCHIAKNNLIFTKLLKFTTMKSLKNVSENAPKNEILSLNAINAIKGGDNGSTYSDPWDKRKKPTGSNAMNTVVNYEQN